MFRFTVAFTTTFVVQLACLMSCSYLGMDVSRLIGVVYLPFSGLTDPLAELWFGTSDGGLAYFILTAVIVGALVYSIPVGFLALYFGRIRKLRN